MARSLVAAVLEQREREQRPLERPARPQMWGPPCSLCGRAIRTDNRSGVHWKCLQTKKTGGPRS